MSLVIRPAAPADLDAVWALCQTVKAQLAADGIAIWNEEYPVRENFAQDLAAGGLLVAEENGQIVGSVSCSADHAEEYYFDLPAGQADAAARALLARCNTTPEEAVGLHRLMVHPALRRAGTAEALLQAAARHCAGKRVTFLVSPGNPPALALYRKLGCTDWGSAAFSFGEMRLFTADTL